MTTGEQALEQVASLSFWKGPVEPHPLEGGITNRNFVVKDGGERFFVRCGSDIPRHGVLRFNELAAARAAALAGISPEVVFHQPGFLITRFIEGKTFTPEDLRLAGYRREILGLIKKCHFEIPKYFRGPALAFWVFHVIRDYGRTLEEGESRWRDKLPDLLAKAEALEAALGPVQLVFGHNDLLAANFIDDGKRLWLIDWDYAGFNTALFDLANLASNNGFSGDEEEWFLGGYHERIPDAPLWRRYRAMVCASLLRESLWSMVQEIHADLDFDFGAYTEDYLGRFKRAHDAFANMGDLS